ncbi:hypothetical protein Syun_016755 [Stephania yunnanensis]|uniref:Leucine-rich repeat-containing N-terminal plant-type domain-containing protein n=1 Tax=Stephania yunnanensis TaxID=152371 RepID=A0AAP0P2G1_9MAGN
MGTLLILIASLLTLLSSSIGDPGGPGCNRCHPDDYNALMKIYNSLNRPYILASWHPNGNCSSWKGIAGEFNGPVPIPAAISNLPYLTSLTLRKLSNLTGPLPPSLANLTRLQRLRLDYNNLTGPIPSSLGRLASLNSIDLSHNQFTGQIPSSLSNLSNLRDLHLDHNNLSGQIPESFGEFAVSPMYLYLSHNQLSGAVPAALGKVDFARIDLSRNRLVGDSRVLFGGGKSTDTLDISRNYELEFDLSNVAFSKKLVSLDINHNKIYGRLPTKMSEIESLQFLNVSYNKLCGEIPGFRHGFDSSSFVHNKCLCGPPLPTNCDSTLREPQKLSSKLAQELSQGFGKGNRDPQRVDSNVFQNLMGQVAELLNILRAQVAA